MYFLFGTFLWTFIEYMLHRFLFHFAEQKRALGPVSRTAHFLFHGVHHAFPLDEKRLVFPVAPAILFHPSLHFIFLTLFNMPRWGFTAGAGGVFGYVMYDCTHYFIHHSKADNGILNFLKRTHNKHHFRNPVRGYGVTSPLWDYVFGTVIHDAKP